MLTTNPIIFHKVKLKQKETLKHIEHDQLDSHQWSKLGTSESSTPAE